MDDLENLLRLIPQVDRILDLPRIRDWIELTSRGFVLGQVNRYLDKLRADFRANEGTRREACQKSLDNLEEALSLSIQQACEPRLTRVVNATGVVIHTNLGRAPLAEQVVEAIRAIAGGYSNLELNLSSGNRGHRDAHLEAQLCEFLHCQAATAVNNNAAAIFLVLNELAAGGEVLVSRGELMEIGGSFRIPEILRKSGASLHEVGTTNKTRLSDYQAGITDSTRLILKVHPSNYRIVGFSECTPLEDLVLLGRQKDIPVVEDAGSGLMQDLSQQGILGEPLAAKSLDAGVDLVTFSADKLLGGPQAGIIAGRAELIARLRRNPLMRVLRLDKITLAALSATLQIYCQGRALSTLPVLRMISLEPSSLRRRASALRRRLAKAGDAAWRFELAATQSAIGGGACPGMLLASWAVAVSSDRTSASRLESALRLHHPPILARIEEDRVLFDMRTLLPGDDAHITRFFDSHRPEP